MTAKRDRARGFGLLAAAGSALLIAAATPAQAQQMDSRWLGWLGCWQPVEQEATGVAGTVCVVPAPQGSGIELISYAGGAEVGRETLSADGTQRAVEQGGCSGHETAAWSADNKRVHVRAELMCEGGNARRATGLIAMASPTEWLDIQAVSADANVAQRGVRVVRYRAVSQEQARMLGAAVPAERALAVETARHAAAVPVTLDQVMETVAQVDTEAVEAWLIERQARLPLNGSRLVALEEAGVPTSVIDLMVALANPQRFAIDHSSRSGALRSPERAASDDLATRRYGYDRFGRPWIDMYDYGYGYGYGYNNRYGYGYGYGSPYRLGSYYTGYQPIIVVVRPGGDGEDPASRSRPRVVRDRGFTRSPSSGAGSEVRSPTTSTGSSSTSAGSSSSQGSGGAAAPPRTAQRRGGDGGQ